MPTAPSGRWRTITGSCSGSAPEVRYTWPRQSLGSCPAMAMSWSCCPIRGSGISAWMSILQADPSLSEPASSWRVLLVGLGGLGCPAALALARAGVGMLRMCDDDVVDEGNLHRQILFAAQDVGTDKLDAAGRALGPVARASGTRVELVREWFLPEHARQLARGVDLVIEGADN